MNGPEKFLIKSSSILAHEIMTFASAYKKNGEFKGKYLLEASIYVITATNMTRIPNKIFIFKLLLLAGND